MNSITTPIELIENLIKLGSLYSDKNIMNFDREKLIVPFKFSEKEQSLAYDKFMGNPHKFTIDKPFSAINEGESYNILAYYSVDELCDILVGIIVAEISIRMERVSVAASVAVFYELAAKNYAKAIEMVEWTKKFGYRNEYFPYGSKDKTAFYVYLYKHSNEEEIVKEMKFKLQIAGLIKFDRESVLSEKAIKLGGW